MDKPSRITDKKEMAANSRKVNLQLSKYSVVNPTMSGPANDEMDLINCPVVRTLAVLSFVNIEATSGLSETCSIVLLIPNNAKATSTHAKS